jgi:hypothetical protein
MAEPDHHRYFDWRQAQAGRKPADPHSRRMDALTSRLPTERLRSAVRWLRQPSARWVRVPAGLLLMLGGVLSILPVLGLWMLPLGVLLLAEDVPLLRRLTDRLMDWMERRRPHWFQPAAASSRQ